METLSVHAGRKVEESTGAIKSPINLSTTFERAEDGSYPKGYIYSRNNNPNRESLEECIKLLERGERCAAFSSGTAAAMAVFQSLSTGDHIICPEDMYHGIKKQIDDIMKRWDLEVSYIDFTDTEEVKEGIRDNTELIWIETPSNPLLKVTDIKRTAMVAKKHDIISACDNTWSTPILQRPLELGCDLVVHSTTKYFGGHSDAVGGAVVANKNVDIFDEIRNIQVEGGACPSPFDCWLISRGIRTLTLRMKKHSKNAMNIAEFLQNHSEVEKVYYPGLKTHPGHEIAKEQMNSFGGMLSFQLKGGKDKAFDVTSDVEIFTRATSLGSVESLIDHRSSIEGEESQTPENLLRLSVGIEHADDLIDDLRAAF
ncbi:MAG: PLP-dependent transferase [Candidatus Thermoplasmatota archaeon]|nr:PLP-dependent transferase [Candidatus Thermoplasmatota archaeon]